MTLNVDRKELICAQAGVITGLDFIRVLDPQIQTGLAVFFLNDPTITPDPATASGFMADAAALTGFDETLVAIAPVETDGNDGPVEAFATVWQRDVVSGRVYLLVTTDQPGGFGDYRLTVQHPSIDRFARTGRFSFKQACPSDFDCAAETDCPQDALPAVAVDYLARDFDSLRRAVLDFAALRFPQWQERIEADIGVMLAEILCAQADEFSYMQDRFARESHFGQATQRRSLMHMARLVDYTIDPGANAATHVNFSLDPASPGLSLAPAAPREGLVVWAPAEGTTAVPFQILDNLANDEIGEDLYWVHPNWTAMPAYAPDSEAPCLLVGATEMYLAPLPDTNASPLTGAQPAGSPRPEVEAWIGRTLILRMDPDEPDRPHRTQRITITEAEVIEDPVATPLGEPTYQITRIAWRAEDALTHEFALCDTAVLGNVVPAQAGRLVTEYLRIGDDFAPGSAQLDHPAAVVRESALHDSGLGDVPPSRPVSLRFGLGETVENGLAHAPDGGPEIWIDEVAGVGALQPSLRSWEWSESLIEADEQMRAFTVEPGQWSEIRRFERLGAVFSHPDYAQGEGFSVFFGNGVFGQSPVSGDFFRIQYRLNPGVAGNLPKNSITVLTDPADPEATLPAALAALNGVENPIASAGGRDPEAPDRIRRFAPVLFRENLLRAVIEKDYQDILGRLSVVQQVGAPQRWTGSWLTRQVTADILGEQGLSSANKALLGAVSGAIRQAGREVVVVDPVYRPLDLVVTICVAQGALFARVRDALLISLFGTDQAPGLLHPDSLTFGTPLIRSALEAAVHGVQGIEGIHQILIRPHQSGVLRPLSEPELRVGGAEILQVRNDPRFPDQGSLLIEDHQAALQASEVTS